MELEEAIKQLKDLKKDMKKDTDDLEGIFKKDVQAIETVLKAYEELKKENEELKNMDLTTVYLKGVADEKERWRNKIREEIEKEKTVVETCYGRIKYQEGKIEGLQNLLEEE